MSAGYAIFGCLVFTCDEEDLHDLLMRTERDWWDTVACGNPIYDGFSHDDAKEWAFNGGREVLRIEEQ